MWGQRPGRPGCALIPGIGGGGRREEEPRRGGSKLPGRWVIYEVLKSIFEAVIYLTALSLNKHRIHLIIVTVETQHSNLLAIAASPSPARLRPGLRRRISPQLHPSGCLCAKAPDSAWPAWPAFAPGSLHRPHPHPSHFSLSYANSCTNECTSLKIICQEQRHHLHSAGICTGWTRPAAGGAREGPWVGATWASVAQRTLVKSRELAL